MNSRQRILTSLACRQPDRVPVIDDIDPRVVRELAVALGIGPGAAGGARQDLPPEVQADLDLYCEVVAELCFDGTRTEYTVDAHALDADTFRDVFGCVYRLSPFGESIILEGPIKEASDLHGFDMAHEVRPEGLASARYVAEHSGDMVQFLSLADPFKLGWLLRGGMSQLLIDFVMAPQLVHNLARVGTDYDLATIEMAVSERVGIDGIFLGGDLADERTTLMSPRHYREFIKPYEKELVDCAHRRGLKIVKHTDGNLWPILDDFLDLPFDGFHPVQPQCMDIAEVKRYVANRLCLLGNIDCRDLLPFGTVDQVTEAVRDTIAQAAPGGGYILSSNSVMPGCKTENLIAMYRAAQRFGVYESSQGAAAGDPPG